MTTTNQNPKNVNPSSYSTCMHKSITLSLTQIKTCTAQPVQQIIIGTLFELIKGTLLQGLNILYVWSRLNKHGSQ